MSEFIEIDFIQVEQPLGSFYIGNMNWNDLMKISEADIRKIHQEDDRNDPFDSYLGIQRKISQKRIVEISEYVNTLDATFPTSIILHIESSYKFIDGVNIKTLDPEIIEKNLEKIVEVNNITIDRIKNKLIIRTDEKIARILDGQHRIEGLRNGFENNPETPKFQFNVTIFVDLDIDDQAQIFSVINKAQTKVNKSLVYDLYEYARFRSPQKSGHDIVRLLNRMPESPFYRKIKLLGTAENKDLETIAQATFVELIINYISSNPMKDRDILRRKSIFGKGKLEKSTNTAEIHKYFFRNLFIEGKDETILNIIWNYFITIQNKWPTAWNNNTIGNILNKSTGVIAFMRFLKPVVNSIATYDAVIPTIKFAEILDKITLTDNSFDPNIYIPGSSGQAALLKELKAQSGLI